MHLLSAIWLLRLPWHLPHSIKPDYDVVIINYQRCWLHSGCCDNPICSDTTERLKGLAVSRNIFRLVKNCYTHYYLYWPPGNWTSLGRPLFSELHALFLPRGIVKIQLVLPLKKSGFSSSLPLVCLLFIYILEHGFFNMVISLSKSMMSW